MQHLDEGTIHVWIDGELSPERASELEAHVRGCASCAALVAEARGLVAASTRILTALDHVPGGVLPSVPEIAPAQVTRRRWYQRTDVRAAAAVLFVAGASLVVIRSTDLSSKSAMIATADRATAASSASIAPETAAVGGSEGAKQEVADALSAAPSATTPMAAEGSASTRALQKKVAATPMPPKTAPELRFGATEGARARNQTVQPNVIADDRAAAAALRDESQLSKEQATKRRAADVANAPPASTARADAAAPAIAAAPTELYSHLDAARGVVEGRVTDKGTGRAVASAQVLVEGTALSATTDKDGKFRVENVPQGPRRLIVRRIGYSVERVAVAIEEGKVAAAQVGISAAPTSLEGVVVTSVAPAPASERLGTAATAKSAAATPLRVVRTDSTSGAKRTVYEVARGVEVTLMESPAETERDNEARDLVRQKAAEPQRQEAARETPQVLSGRVAGAVTAQAAAPTVPLNTISWTDRGKRYTLSGRLTVKELEGIKTRLMQARR